MAKVAVVGPERARAVSAVAGLGGNGALRAYVDGAGNPIHLHLAELGPGENLHVGPLAGDCAAYVWQGDVEAGPKGKGVALAAGSSAIIERGGALELVGGEGGAQALLFTGGGAADGSGGSVHLLPAARVPRMEPEPLGEAYVKVSVLMRRSSLGTTCPMAKSGLKARACRQLASPSARRFISVRVMAKLM